MAETGMTPESQDEFEAGLERGGLTGENKTFAELFLSGIGGGNAIDPKMLKQANEYYNSLQSSVQKKKGQKATEYSERLGSLYTKLQESQDKPMSGGEIIARAVIGLAPTLIGAAAGSAMGIGTGLGGAAGGAAGIAGLSQLEQAREKQREQEQRRLASQIEGVRKIQEEELKTLGQTERDIEKAKLELPLLAGKGAMQLKIAETKGKATTAKGEVSWPEDLGAGFKVKPVAPSAYKPLVFSNIKSAQTKIGAYNKYNAAIDDVIRKIGKGGLGKATSWTDAGRDLRAALDKMILTGKEYENLGAALTGVERSLLMNVGIDPAGSILEKYRLVEKPQVLIDRLKQLKQSIRGSIGAEVEPLGVMDTGKKADQEKDEEGLTDRQKRIQELRKQLGK